MQELRALLDLLAMLAGDPYLLVLLALLVAAAVSDWRRYRIPNPLTFGGAMFALLYPMLIGRPPMAALLAWLGGMLTGLLLMLPLHLMRVMGAGDVKLMAMVGAFLGVPATLYAVLFTFVVGGIAALAVALRRRQLASLLTNVRSAVYAMALTRMAGLRPDGRGTVRQSVGRLPYGVCICIGTVASVVARQLGYA